MTRENRKDTRELEQRDRAEREARSGPPARSSNSWGKPRKRANRKKQEDPLAGMAWDPGACGFRRRRHG